MSERGPGSGDPGPRARLPSPRIPLPPPTVPPPAPERASGARSRAPARPPEEGRPGALARPAPDRPARRRTPPLALLVLGGSGAFLLLVVGAAVLGAIAGSPGSFARPTQGGDSPATSAPSSRAEETHGSPERNALYRTGTMRGVRCDADLRSAEPGAYERFVRRSTDCLNRAWRAQLAEHGIPRAAPGLVLSRSENPTSPCRSSTGGYTPVAFYCPANRTVYYSLSTAAKTPLPKNREYLISSSAHEYAHHVQQLAGISDVYHARYNRTYPDVDRSTRLTRRLELQAQCFAGVFVGSNAQTMRVTRAAMAASAGRTGDDALDGASRDPTLRIHGSFANNRRWMITHGWDRRAPVACNTWTAPAAAID